MPRNYADNSSLLRPGENCWRVSPAERATLLIDGEEYFAALRAALLQARKLVLIAGWDFDSRIQLPPPAGATGELLAAPTHLGDFLGYLVRTRPGLQIHVIRWDYHWLYRDDRECDTRQQLEVRGIRFYDDGCHPPMGCVHHKLVVIDDALAFIGGIDLTHNRWDTRQHDPGDARRRDPHGEVYMPVHDTQLCVSGPIAADLGGYLRDNWPQLSPPPIQPGEVCWPASVPVHFRNIRAGICRTLPAPPHSVAVREVEAFLSAAIARVHRSLYLENQYFTCRQIAEAIARRCREMPQLEGLLVGMERPKTAAELHTMGHGLRLFYDALVRGDAIERIPLVAAVCDHGSINLHSKLGVFDDRWLTVGSVNLNRRSMGFDIECNLVLEATTPAHRQRIEALRNDLIAEHLSMQPSEVAAAVSEIGLARLPQLGQGRRRLVPVRPQEFAAHLGPLLVPLFDRDRTWSSAAQAPLLAARGALASVAGFLLLGLSGFALWEDDVPPLAYMSRNVSTAFDNWASGVGLVMTAPRRSQSRGSEAVPCDNPCSYTRTESRERGDSPL